MSETSADRLGWQQWPLEWQNAIPGVYPVMCECGQRATTDVLVEYEGETFRICKCAECAKPFGGAS